MKGGCIHNVGHKGNTLFRSSAQAMAVHYGYKHGSVGFIWIRGTKSNKKV